MLNTLRTAIYVQPWVAVLPGAAFSSPRSASTW
jgi:ABC-type antimicrobial peptide transport system permease subunit